jgi:hypothetical protein
MIRPVDLLRQDRKDELWEMCCGFIDLSLDQFMAIQERLLLEQIELLKNSELGRKIMNGAWPETVEEFRKKVPLTTYGNYYPELPQRRDSALPGEVDRWIRAPGRLSEYDAKKWVPISMRFSEECEKVCAAFTIFALCKKKGDVSKVKEHLKVLYTMGGAKYASGVLGHFTQKAINLDFLPSNGEHLSFADRAKNGFNEALYKGIDGFGGIPSVLVAIGEQIKHQSIRENLRSTMHNPRALYRLIKGLAKSKIARRPLLPRDLWEIKVILGGGTDSAIFKDRVKELWGRYPLELYAGTEGGVYAMQTWDYDGMTFVPNLNFMEFIPEEEQIKWQIDNSYQPKTVLLNEVEAGKNYELVITNFHGGSLVRFRIGDMIRITALRNENLDIDIPQMVFYGRADDVIDVTGLGRLSGMLIWQAIENTGIPYVDWTARREISEDRATMHLYIELKDGYVEDENVVAEAFGEELKKLNRLYHYNPYSLLGDFDSIVGIKPIEVTLLPRGAFDNYISSQYTAGVDMGHLKPPRINPSDNALALLKAEYIETAETEMTSTGVNLN